MIDHRIKRRQFLQTAGVGAASALLSRSSARANSSPRGPNRNKPNVLLIMTDQHRADLIGKMHFVDAHNHGFEYYIYNHGATHELYDREADPGEFADRINDPALRKIRNRLHDRLLMWYNPEKNPYRPKRM